MHLLSGQFAINPQLQSTILLSIIICYQILTSSQSLFLTFFVPKICNKWKNSQHLEFFSDKLCVGMEPAHFVASSKGINLSKDINKYLYFHYKDKANNTIIQSTYRCQKNRHGFKVRSCSTKRVQRTGFDSNWF